MSGRNFPCPVFRVISMQIFTLIPCVPFGIWAEMNTCDMRTLLRWDWQEALLHGSPRRNMPPTRGCTGKHHRGAAEADCHHSTNTIKSDPPAKVCARAMFPRVDRSCYHGCSCMWGCELRPLQLTCTRVATWSTQLSAVGGTTVASRQVLPSWCSRLDTEGSLLTRWRGAALKPSRAAITASSSSEKHRPLCFSSLRKQRDFRSWWVSLWFQSPRDVSSEKRKKKKSWVAGAGSAGADPGRCSITSQHQQLPRYAAHPYTNGSRLGSVVPDNKIARVAVKWILSLFTSLQLAPCIIYLMAFALFSWRFSSFISSGDNSELHVRWEDVTLAQSWWLKLNIAFFTESANLWWMNALANINHRSSAQMATVNGNRIIPVDSVYVTFRFNLSRAVLTKFAKRTSFNLEQSVTNVASKAQPLR